MEYKNIPISLKKREERRNRKQKLDETKRKASR